MHSKKRIEFVHQSGRGKNPKRSADVLTPLAMRKDASEGIVRRSPNTELPCLNLGPKPGRAQRSGTGLTADEIQDALIARSRFLRDDFCGDQARGNVSGKFEFPTGHVPRGAGDFSMPRWRNLMFHCQGTYSCFGGLLDASCV